ncbi:MAG: sugar phosphate nucleotidyltransferase [Bacteroidia bacterium]|nr:sugar phosphate nucleotidyltransferase [Bacteroidia bacterium]MDW8235789.1 sugar phosphate nucleotidyltransferase [Bacteroidia bacterium]
MRTKIHALILAGGSGTRFWPVSRNAHPKQFLDILGTGRSLLQSTYARLRKILPDSQIWLVGNRQHLPLLQEQLPEMPLSHLLLEPLQRNTAPSILWSTLHIHQLQGDVLLWIMPADHYIPDEDIFLELMQGVFQNCDFSQAIFTVGIRPKYPHTGYGYIQYASVPNSICYPVKTFTEKPSQELAEVFVQSGEFLWNAGMFIARTTVLLHAFQQYSPEIYEIFQGLSPDSSEEVLRAFQRAPSISFDYAIMEKYSPVMVVEGNFRWWDLGGWNAVHEVSPCDERGNRLHSISHLKDVRNSFIYSATPDKLIIVEGLSDYLVIDTPDALLILPKAQEQGIREWVQTLKTSGREEYL